MASMKVITVRRTTSKGEIVLETMKQLHREVHKLFEVLSVTEKKKWNDWITH